MLLKEMGYNDNQPDALSYSVGYISSGHFNPAITIAFPCTAFDRKFLNRGLRGTVNERLKAILRCYRGGFEFKKEGSQQRKAAHKCVLFLKGIVLTLPAMATTMPNLTPGNWRVKLSCLYSKVKILGTLLCVVSAFTMSIMQSTTSDPATEIQYQAHSLDVIFDKQKIISCLYLLATVFVLFSNVDLQNIFHRVFITAAAQLIQDHKIETGWLLVSARDLIGFSLLGGTLSGACISFNGWAMEKRGPVLVSLFSPIGTICSVVLLVITLGEFISVGRHSWYHRLCNGRA